MIVRLKRQPQYCQDDLQRLRAVMPACTRAVWFDDKVICLATMTEYEPHEILQVYGRELRPFETIGVYELGKLSASTDSSADPFNFWMDYNVRQGQRRESDEAEDMLKRKWGQRRFERPENSGVANTFRKVFSRTPKSVEAAKQYSKPD